MRRKLILGIAAAVCLIIIIIIAFVIGCDGGEEIVLPTEEPTATPTPAPTPPPTPTPSPTPSPTPTPDPYEGLYGVNPLTGLPIDEAFRNRRPAAVMLNNLKRALPMLGISQADIIYEAPAEGGITRMLGVYQNPSEVPTIGSVRSTRAYYLDLAQGHDAILLHAGFSEEARVEIKRRGVTNMDCLSIYEGSLYWRDQERIRTKGLEHSVLTSGERIEKAYAELKGRIEHEPDWRERLLFADNGTPAGGEAALSISIQYSSYKTGLFEYDAATGLYCVSQYGEPFIDGEDNTQVSVTNVLILYAPIRSQGDRYGLLSIDLVGSGEGRFACGGKIIPIRWSKGSYDSPFVYTLTDGKPLTLGRGRSYVNIISSSYTVTVE